MAKFNLSRLVKKERSRLTNQRHQGSSKIVDIISDDSTSPSSSSLPSVGSQRSRLDTQQHCKKGLDIIEDIFSSMFGGCYRPESFPASRYGARAVMHSHNIDANQPYDEWNASTRPACISLGCHCDSSSLDRIPHPPEIRRLALDDEDAEISPDVDPSGELSFLFYQDSDSSTKESAHWDVT